MYIKESVNIGGKELSIETGKMAKQADGSVVVRYGDTMVLVTAVANKSAREGVDFLPLTVEYTEDNPGDWLYHCHVTDHMAGGMVGRYTVH